jgi:hypothetical protein
MKAATYLFVFYTLAAFGVWRVIEIGWRRARRGRWITRENIDKINDISKGGKS